MLMIVVVWWFANIYFFSFRFTPKCSKEKTYLTIFPHKQNQSVPMQNPDGNVISLVVYHIELVLVLMSHDHIKPYIRFWIGLSWNRGFGIQRILLFLIFSSLKHALFIDFSICLQWKPPICLVSADSKADAAFSTKNYIMTQILCPNFWVPFL